MQYVLIEMHDQQIVEAVARAEGADPTSLVVPLADVIDTDALDALFRDGAGRVTFSYYGYTVTVTHAGEVSVEPAVEV